MHNVISVTFRNQKMKVIVFVSNGMLDRLDGNRFNELEYVHVPLIHTNDMVNINLAAIDRSNAVDCIRMHNDMPHKNPPTFS